MQKLHYQRQFLATDEGRYDRAHCYSYVYLHDDGWLEAELAISDGYDTINLDATREDDEVLDAHLAVITLLMAQIIDYRQALAEALAVKRGQAVTRG